MRLILFIILIIFSSCKTKSVNEVIKSEQDRKYLKKYFLDSLQYSDNLTLLPLCEYDSAIRLIYDDSWGMAFLSLTIYKKEDNYVFQYYRYKTFSGFGFVNKKEPEIQFKEVLIPENEWCKIINQNKRIESLIDSSEKTKTLIRLNTFNFDGGSYVLLYKLGNNNFGFQWQNLTKAPLDLEIRSAFIELLNYESKTTTKYDIRISEEKTEDSLDIVIMQKLLPKLHGSRSKLVKVLIALAALCIEDKQKEI